MLRHIWLALAMLGFWGFPAGASANNKPRKMFLTVGISQYADSRWPRLNYSSKDATDMAGFLRENFDSGIQLDESLDTDGVTLADLRQSLDRIKADNQFEDDTILVYISTHGTLGRRADDGGALRIQKYLVTHDTAYDRVSETALGFRELMDWFKSLKSRRKALVIDACYSGGGKAHLNATMLSFLAQQKAGAIKEPDEDAVEGTGIYAASAWGEEAREDPKLGNGVYTYFLLKAFREDPNGDGATQLSEAHAIASNWVIDYTKGEQHPSAQLEFIGRDPMVIRGEVRKGALPYILALQKDVRNYILRLNGKSVGDLSKGILEVPEGAARLEIVDPRTQRVIAERSVELFEHETYTLESLLFEKKLNRIDTGLSQLRFGSNHARSRIYPDALQAWHVGFHREGIWGTMDGLLRLTSLQAGTSTVQIDEQIADGPVSVYQEKQRIDGWKLDLWLGRKQRLPVLTPKRQDWITSMVYGTGPSFLQLDRQLPEWDRASDLDKSASTLGWSAQLGLDVFWPIRNLHAGLEGSYQLYSDQFTSQGSVVDLWSVGIHFGLSF